MGNDAETGKELGDGSEGSYRVALQWQRQALYHLILKEKDIFIF